MTSIVSGHINLGAGDVSITSGDLTLGSPPPPPSRRLIVGFHSLSNSWSALDLPTSFPGAYSFLAPNYDNAVNMGSDAQLAGIKSDIDAKVLADGITEIWAGGISGGTYTALMFAAKYPGFIKRFSLHAVLYDLPAWSNEANSGDWGQVVSGVGGGQSISANPRPYFEKSPRWTLDQIGEAAMTFYLNHGTADTVIPIHHARECYRRLKGLPNVTAFLNEVAGGGHTPDAGLMVTQLS